MKSRQELQIIANSLESMLHLFQEHAKFEFHDVYSFNPHYKEFPSAETTTYVFIFKSDRGHRQELSYNVLTGKVKHHEGDLAQPFFNRIHEMEDLQFPSLKEGN